MFLALHVDPTVWYGCLLLYIMRSLAATVRQEFVGLNRTCRSTQQQETVEDLPRDLVPAKPAGLCSTCISLVNMVSDVL